MERGFHNGAHTDTDSHCEAGGVTKATDLVFVV